jgi:hypothetical protein
MSEINKVGMGDAYEASVTSNPGQNAAFGISGRYDVKCHDKEGNMKWEDSIENLVVNTGLSITLNGSLANAAQGPVFMGLKGSYSVVAGTTLSLLVADTSNGELVGYTVGGTEVRASPSFTAVAAGTTSISPTAAQVFLITVGQEVFGCFLVTGTGASSTQRSTGGQLFSAGNFSSSKVVSPGDSLSVTYTATGTSS